MGALGFRSTRRGLALGAAGIAGARAQAFPTRPVRLITPLSAGSQADLLARLVAQRLSDLWGQPVLVENHPGGAGQVAGRLLLSAPADGHTLMLHSDGHAVSAALYAARLPYDTLADFARISLVASSPGVLVVAPTLGARDVAGLVALARQRQGGLTFGSAGTGGGIHLTGELFKASTAIEATHIPFRGMPEALTEVMTGRVDFAFSAPQPVTALLREGRLLPLGVSTPERSPVLPDVPSVAEQGYPGFAYELWWGVFGQAGLAAALVERISANIVGVVADPALRARLLGQGIVPRGEPPAAFDRFVRSEVARLVLLAAGAGIGVD